MNKYADCHGERKHYAKGFCGPCYRVRHNRKDPIAHQLRAKRWIENHKEQDYALRRKGMLRRIYGLTVEQYNKMLADQNGRCAICLTNEPKGTGTWHVDHDHKTGQVRGLLCASCNLCLGRIDKDPERILKGIVAYYANQTLS